MSWSRASATSPSTASSGRVAKTLGHENANVTLGIYAHLYDRKNEDDTVRLALAGEAS